MERDMNTVDDSSILVYEYHLKKCLYSLSFRNRCLFHLGILDINCSFKNREKLSRGELIKAIKELKKPWWNFLFFGE